LTTPAIQIANGTMNVLQEMNGGEAIGPDGVFSKNVVTKEMLDAENLETLEHITVQVWISHTRRGDVAVELISPNQVRSILAAPRAQDSDPTGFPGWTFMTVKHWYVEPR
jgi:kexin